MGSDFSKEDCSHHLNMDKRNLDNMRDYLRNYSSPEGCVDCLNILLLGLNGTEKSSTINTFLSALDRRGATITCAPTGTSPESLTSKLKSYRAGKLKFWDTTGWNAMDPDPTKRLDWTKKKRVFKMILDGRVPNETDLRTYNPNSDLSKYPIIPENIIHGVAFTFDVNTMDSIDDNPMHEILEFQKIVADNYIHRIVIVTKIDLSGIREKDIAWIYEYKPLQQKFEDLTERIGTDKNSIFVVSNVWRGRWIDKTKCILALYALENMVKSIDGYLKSME